MPSATVTDGTSEPPGRRPNTTQARDWFTGVTIGQKIRVAVVIGLAGILGAAFLYAWNVRRETAATHAMAQALEMRGYETSLQLGILQMRRHEEEFLVRAASGSADAVDASAGDLDRLLAKISAGTKSAEIKDLVATIENCFVMYLDRFHAVRAERELIGADATQGLIGNVRGDGKDVEGTLRAVDATRALIPVLVMRRLEHNFLVDPTPRYVDEMKAQFALFDDAMAEAPLAGATKASIDVKKVKYREDFLRLAAAELALAQDIQKTSDVHAMLEPKLAQLDQLITAGYDVALADREAILTASRTAQWVVLGMVLAVLGGVAWLIGGGVVRPIVLLSEATERLAQGDIAVPIEGTERRDEVGNLARSLAVFKDGMIERNRLAATLTEAEAQRHAEEGRRQSEERFRALVENSNETILVVDTDGIITYRSPTVTRPFGRGPDDVVGRALNEFCHPDDVDEVTASFADIRVEPGRYATGRSRVFAIGKDWPVISWSARNAIDVPGIGGIIIHFHDVTERAKLEEQLLQARKMEAMGQLAGGIAHDFNNLLGSILGFAGFLVDDLPAESPQRGFATRIVAASERARDLVRQILAFARQGSLERKPHDLVSVVRDTCDLVRAALPGEVRLEIDARDGVLVAAVSATQIGQVLYNLCINAKDALAGKPGIITVSAGRVALHGKNRLPPGPGFSPEHAMAVGTIDPDRPYARISVADNGGGIEPRLLKRIFDPFYTTKERGRGTGLGLSVAHGIVMAYEGAWLVTSRPGQGSTFTLYLPLSEDSPSAGTEEARPPERRGRERILVVDDDPDIADVLRFGLTRLGYQVGTETDPLAALATFSRDPASWDLVITDQIMPRMRGLGLIARLKDMRPALPVVLCSGFSDGATEDQAMATGANAFLLKPVAMDALAATVRDLLDTPPPAGISAAA